MAPIELQLPTPARLSADFDAPLGQQLSNFTQAEREAEIQLHRMADHLRREALALVGNRSNGRIQLPLLAESGDLLTFA